MCAFTSLYLCLLFSNYLVLRAAITHIASLYHKKENVLSVYCLYCHFILNMLTVFPLVVDVIGFLHILGKNKL